MSKKIFFWKRNPKIPKKIVRIFLIMTLKVFDFSGVKCDWLTCASINTTCPLNRL